VRRRGYARCGGAKSCNCVRLEIRCRTVGDLTVVLAVGLEKWHRPTKRTEAKIGGFSSDIGLDYLGQIKLANVDATGNREISKPDLGNKIDPETAHYTPRNVLISLMKHPFKLSVRTAF
jgi:hypothetical protein